MATTTAPPNGDVRREKFSADFIWRRRLRSTLQRLSWQAGVWMPPACWRVLEFSTALCLSVILLPLLAVVYLIAKCLGGGIQRTRRVGENAREFDEFSFSFSRNPTGSSTAPLVKAIKRLPALANVMLATMSLVGPRTLSRRDIRFHDRSVWKRFDVRPGLFGLWSLRKRANIAYDREAVVDAEYANSRSVRTDLGILLRSVPAAFCGSASHPAARKIQLLGVPIDNISMAEAIDEISTEIPATPSRQICFVNVDCINIAQSDADYAGILHRSDLVLADGMGIKLAGNFLKTAIRQNVNGTDLLPRLCERLAEQESSVYLLGGLPGVAEAVKDWMLRTYPRLRVAGCQDGYFPESEMASVVANIRMSEAKILLVAMGAPKQEKWIRDHAAAAGVSVAIGVGGLFDYYAGRIQRAPIWVRELGMEWLFRLVHEPGRLWKRYLIGNAVFAARILFARVRRTGSGDTSPC